MNRGPGWWGEHYRHSLAARGIQTDDIYVNVHGRMTGLDRSMFDRYQPVEGEIYALKLLVKTMDVFDSRSGLYSAPLAYRESPVMLALVQELMKRMEPEYFSHDEFLNEEFNKVYDDIRKYKLSGRQYQLMMAVNRILFIFHRSPLSTLHFLGRDIPESVRLKCQMISETEVDRFWRLPECVMEFEEIMEDDMVGWFVVQSALELQRSATAATPTPERAGIGEGQEMIRLWIEELDRRRLT